MAGKRTTSQDLAAMGIHVDEGTAYKVKAEIIVGIDPDTDKSGVAIKKGKDLAVSLMKFWDLSEKLSEMQGQNVLVRISAGWLINKTNFHRKIKVKGKWVEPTGGLRDKISERVGRNHQVGMLIAELCERLELRYALIVPSGAKWTPEHFEGVTGIKTRNQEKIDAGQLTTF